MDDLDERVFGQLPTRPGSTPATSTNTPSMVRVMDALVLAAVRPFAPSVDLAAKQ
jgi:hypothetical protein